VQEDVYQGNGLNLYAYCRNNPVVYYDPSGYSCKNSGGYGSDEYDEYLDDESPRKIRVGKQKGNAPRSNQKQNKQFRRAVKS
jgi:hypothetical protein